MKEKWQETGDLLSTQTSSLQVSMQTSEVRSPEPPETPGPVLHSAAPAFVFRTTQIEPPIISRKGENQAGKLSAASASKGGCHRTPQRRHRREMVHLTTLVSS